MGAHAGACTRYACCVGVWEAGRLEVGLHQTLLHRVERPQQACLACSLDRREAYTPHGAGGGSCAAPQQRVQEPRSTWPVFSPLQADYAFIKL